ncbi:hypothetical protein D3C80_1508130 [compost metagenome]
MLAAQVWEAGQGDASAVRRVAAGAGWQAVLDITAVEQGTATFDQLWISSADAAILAGEVGSDIGHILIIERGKHAGHFQHGALARLDVVQLFFQVLLTLACKFREIRRHAVAVRIVTRATYSSFGLTSSGIPFDRLCGIGGTGDAQGQQQTHE